MIFNIEPKNIFKLKKLLSLLCQSKLYELNISKLSTKIEINRNTLYHYSKIGDFVVDGKYVVEVGGKNKSFKQIQNVENSFVISDDIEIGLGNKIPLWLFGFLY